MYHLEAPLEVCWGPYWAPDPWLRTSVLKCTIGIVFSRLLILLEVENCFSLLAFTNLSVTLCMEHPNADFFFNSFVTFQKAKRCLLITQRKIVLLSGCVFITRERKKSSHLCFIWASTLSQMFFLNTSWHTIRLQSYKNYVKQTFRLFGLWVWYNKLTFDHRNWYIFWDFICYFRRGKVTLLFIESHCRLEETI